MNGRPEAAGEGPAPAPERSEGGEDTPALAPAAPEAAPGDVPQGEALPRSGGEAAADAAAGTPGAGDSVPAQAALGAGDGTEAKAPDEAGAAADALSPPAADTPSPADEPSASTGETSPSADDPRVQAGEPDQALLAEGVRIAEALIFASDRPVSPAVLSAVLPEGLSPAGVAAALAAACEGRGVVLAEVAGGWAFRTAPDLAQRLTKVVQAPRRLPRAAMEALSVIAYHQPCTRGEIEEIRGASLAQTTLEALLELGLIAPRGRREVPGRPTLWGTTPKFLEQFGLKALSDLPRKEELVTAETGPALPGLAPASTAPDAASEAEAGDPLPGSDAETPGGAADQDGAAGTAPPAEPDTPDDQPQATPDTPPGAAS